jgi:pimeloyl-ACP methyl ester carboxylesterase
MEEKMVKFDAQTFFEELKQLNYEEIRELYKGLIAYQTGQEAYNEAVDKAAEVALEYYLKYKDVSKLAIIASPLLKPKRNIVYYLKVYKYKLTKKIIKYNKEKIGSDDYKKCPKEMKNFFVSVVNKHYNDCIKEVDIPVLLLWGNKDSKVPINKAKKLHKVIKNSKLHIIKGNHFAYLENLMYTKLVLNEFFRR